MSERKMRVKERERKRGGERNVGFGEKNERVRTRENEGARERENEGARERENSISRWIDMLIDNVEDVGCVASCKKDRKSVCVRD